MAKLDFEKLNSTIRYLMFTAYKVQPGALGEDRVAVTEEARSFLASYDDADLEIRGIYDVAGLRAEADFMTWVHAERIEDGLEAVDDLIADLQSSLDELLRVEAARGAEIPAAEGAPGSSTAGAPVRSEDEPSGARRDQRQEVQA